MNLALIWCAFGWHSWCMICCRSSEAENNTHRECARCPRVEERETPRDEWKAKR
jgi:hypothetical protein